MSEWKESANKRREERQASSIDSKPKKTKKSRKRPKYRVEFKPVFSWYNREFSQYVDAIRFAKKKNYISDDYVKVVDIESCKVIYQNE